MSKPCIPEQSLVTRQILQLLLLRESEDVLGKTGHVVSTVKNSLAAVSVGKLEVEESSALADLEDTLLLAFIIGEEFLEGDDL